MQYEDSADENQYMDDYNNGDGSTQYQVLHPIDGSLYLVVVYKKILYRNAHVVVV